MTGEKDVYQGHNTKVLCNTFSDNVILPKSVMKIHSYTAIDFTVLAHVALDLIIASSNSLDPDMKSVRCSEQIIIILYRMSIRVAKS